MTKSLTRWLCLLLCSFVLIGTRAAHANNQDWEQRFQSHVQQWIASITEQDGQFQAWRGARTEVQSLGANQHQWLVAVTKSGEQVGYLIVAEVPGQEENPSFVLLEYGVGEYILFDDAFAPLEVGAEPVYDGFASYWKVARHNSQQLIDAKTAERYPANALPDAPVMSTVPVGELAGSAHSLTVACTFNAAATDPFDQIGWMQDSGMSLREVPWKQLMEKAGSNSLVLTVSLFRNEVIAPFSVNSLHLWDSRAAYLGVWDEGLRFVPYAYAQKVGTLHVNKEGAGPY